ncbi:MAG: hypothetical protein Q9212_002993 [Teloschistes hypoglaucus]
MDGDMGEDETEESVAEDEDKDEDEQVRESSQHSIESGPEITEANQNARLANQAMVDAIAWTHNPIDEDIFTVNMRCTGGTQRSRYWEGIDDAVEGVYTHLADANAAALRWFYQEFGGGIEGMQWDSHEEIWNGSGQLGIFCESEEEGMVDIYVERSTLTRRTFTEVDDGEQGGISTSIAAPLQELKADAEEIGNNNEVAGDKQEDRNSNSSSPEDDEDNIAARMENEKAVAAKDKTHGLAEETIYTVRIDHKFQHHWEGEDFSVTEGAYTYLPDATAAAISWFEDRYGKDEWGTCHHQEWTDGNIDWITIGCEENGDNVVQLCTDSTTFLRRVPLEKSS